MLPGFIRRIALLLLPLLIVGCGGGGGSATTSNPPSGTSREPPSLPSPTYQGQTTPAQLSPFVAGQVSAFVFADVDLTISFSENLVNPFLSVSGSGPINSTQSGPAGGQVTLNGYVSNQNNGWIVENFTNYAFIPTGATTSVTLNGQLLVEVSGSTVSFGYTNYSIQGTGFNTELSGNASQQLIPGNNYNNQTTTTTTTLNLGILDHIVGIDEEFVKFTVQSVSGPNITVGAQILAIDRTFSGRVYDSDAGYLDIATQGTETYLPDPTKLLPIYGVNILVTGSSNTSPLLIGPLNYYFFAVGTSTNNNNVFNASARYNWTGFTVDTTPASVGTGPVAIAEEATSPAVGVPMTLDGRFSHSPSGDYLQMQWSLLYSTPGSHPVLANAGMPEATLTVDKPGDYLVLLTVTDGSETSQDTLTVRIPANNTPTETFPMFQTVAGPDVAGTIGTPILLDGRASFDAFDDGNAPTYNWHLIAPPGSQAVLSNPTSAQPSFTPDVPGYYHVLLNFPFMNTYGSPSAQSLTVTVGEPIAFRPPVYFDGSLNGSYLFKITDINGDGLPDILLYPGNVANQVNVYLSTGNGTFATPDVLTLPTSGVQQANGIYAAIGDLNGDGRPDIVVSGMDANGQSAVYVFLQNSDGSFSAPQEYTYPMNTGFTGPVAIGHLFGSNTLSVYVITIGGSYDFLVNGNGTLQTPTSISLPNWWPGNNDFDLIDFNGDGLADIVGDDYMHGDDSLLTATTSDTFATFDIQATGVGSVASVGDLYGDGHNEVVVTGQTSLQVFSEIGTSPTSYPLVLTSPSAIGIRDVNGDGLMDIALIYSGDCNTYGTGVCIYDLGLLFQQTDHSFGSEVIVPLDGAGSSGPLWIGDMNGDGVPDLMYTSGGKPVIQFGYKP